MPMLLMTRGSLQLYVIRNAAVVKHGVDAFFLT